MRAPGFWRASEGDGAPVGALARLLMLALQPAAFIYGRITARRMARAGAEIGVPVICIGNFVAGGAGKTPTALALGARLAAQGVAIAFVSRGYGGALSAAPQPVRVDPQTHSAADVGDEPLLLAAHAPTFIHRDRLAAARCAVAAGAQAIVLDDGLQNPALHKDFAIAVVDGAAGVGNGRVLPAGPLRAPLADQWAHVDAVVVIGQGAEGAALAVEAARRGKMVAQARLAPEPDVAAQLRGRRVLAFAGIGRPEKFADTLRELGAEVVDLVAFADHQPFRRADLAPLLARAQREGLVLVTTAKDMARLRRGASDGGAADGELADIAAAVTVLPVSLVFDDATALDQALRSVTTPAS